MTLGRVLRASGLVAASAILALAADRVKIETGTLEGNKAASGVRQFLGIPFATPPTGDLRWKAPKPAAKWTGVRQATEFGPHCMQNQVYNDMIFRDKGPSEDCLYLNVWTPAAKAGESLPVMVWIYGGGFQAGGSSEPRQDGSKLATKGVVVVSMNYRLGVFGFLAHPELTKESDRNASGNYGLMDQTAALEWVKRNIREFGGDPSNVTIFGESAGSFSVSAQMASPIARGLFHKAIGESGALLGQSLPAATLARSEGNGVEFMKALGATTLAEMRAKPATDVLAVATKLGPGIRFSSNIDGYFIPESPLDIYAKGKQAPVPLLAGWNMDEQGPGGFFGKEPQTLENYKALVEKRFGDNAAKVLAAYPADSDETAKRAAADLAGDQFIGYSTWKWIERQSSLPNGPAVYRYHFEQAPPAPEDGVTHGAFHSADIEFVFGMQAESRKLPWRDEDREVSGMMMSYWSNFAKKGDPNGDGLLEWPAYNRNPSKPVMHLKASPDVTSDADPCPLRVAGLFTGAQPQVSDNERRNDDTGKLTADVLDADVPRNSFDWRCPGCPWLPGTDGTEPARSDWLRVSTGDEVKSKRATRATSPFCFALLLRQKDYTNSTGRAILMA